MRTMKTCTLLVLTADPNIAGGGFRPRMQDLAAFLDFGICYRQPGSYINESAILVAISTGPGSAQITAPSLEPKVWCSALLACLSDFGAQYAT